MRNNHPNARAIGYRGRMSVLVLMTLVPLCATAQQTVEKRPKIVVGVVVDQMRREYLDRFHDKFGNDGFRRLMREGFDLRNAHYDYVPTYTGPGHASIYTGTTPAVHGIVGNDWYDKELKQVVNCVNDPRQKAVGSPTGNGTVSPWRMLSTTVTDELEIFTQGRSRTIGLSLKDRGAVLPAGHLADGAYWFDASTGGFLTSTFYRRDLPAWMQAFNKQGLADQYMRQAWNTQRPIAEYTESGPDNTPYEGRVAGKSSPVFPYDMNAAKGADKSYGALSVTPYGNDLLTAAALAALAGEKMGQGAETDFLAISYSATDGLGHTVGPQAVELEDMYIRLDQNIAELLNALDRQVGQGNYLLFLTADHAVAEVAQQMKDKNVPAGIFDEGALKKNLNSHLAQYFPGREMVEAISNNQVFFNADAFADNPRSSGVDLIIAAEITYRFLMKTAGIAQVFTESTIRQSAFDDAGIKGMVVRGFSPKRSGDVAFVLEPGWYGAGSTRGTTHGSPYTYDTHVPVIFFGNGIKQGSSVRHHSITDIAPTLSMLLRIKLPSASTGKPVEELFTP